MENNDPKSKEDVRDPIGKLGWPLEKGRDGERTPMQWNVSANAGFSMARPWLPVPPSAETHNVESELRDPGSVLNFYKRLLFLRHHEESLLDGEYIPLNENSPGVLCYLRRYKNEAVLVVLNMSGSLQKFDVDLAPYGLAGANRSTLLTDMTGELQTGGKEMSIEPFAVYIAKLTK